MQVLRVVILDFDGVVLESNAVKTEAFRSVFARFPEHADAMMDFHFAHVSLSRFAKFDHLLERMGRAGDQALKADLASDFSRRTLEGIMAVPFVPGAEAFLREVTPRVPVYLASVTPADDLSLVLERRGLTGWFRGVYACPPWTKADAIRNALARESAQPAQALLVGDSAGDQSAAMQTGVQFVARDSGLGFGAPPPVTFPDLFGVAEFVGKRLA